VAEVYINPQLRPAAATTSDLYTVPGATRTLISSILVCNDDSVSTTVRVMLAPLGAADAAVHRVVADAPIAANTTVGFTLGVTLKATDKIRCRSASGNVNFHLVGVEKS
jgi:hypothetical protein